jgi:mono/diheme cytochrome c family protein
MKLFILGFFTAIVVLIVGGLALIYSGAYNVAADREHTALEKWLLSTAMIRSVNAHADHEMPPTDLNDEHRIRDGSRLFDEMCVQCHGAPGKKPGEVGLGLRPQPPSLSEAAGRWSAAQLLWIVRHGIKATGMPAFGGTHTDDQLWNLVAFVQKLPGLSPEKYKSFDQGGGLRHEHEQHEH